MKRVRSANLSDCEKLLLIELVLKYESVVENKRTDAVATNTKEEGWRQLTDELNSESTAGVRGECQQLKNVCKFAFRVQYIFRLIVLLLNSILIYRARLVGSRRYT